MDGYSMSALDQKHSELERAHKALLDLRDKSSKAEDEYQKSRREFISYLRDIARVHGFDVGEDV